MYIPSSLLWPISIIITIVFYILLLQCTDNWIGLIIIPFLVLLLCLTTLSTFVIPDYQGTSDQSSGQYAETVDGNMPLANIVDKLGILTMSDLTTIY